MGSQSAHILRMPGLPLAKDLPGLIYHHRAQSNAFLLRAVTATSFLTIRQDDCYWPPRSRTQIHRFFPIWLYPGLIDRECQPHQVVLPLDLQGNAAPGL
jgi:hypothetical protein